MNNDSLSDDDQDLFRQQPKAPENRSEAEYRLVEASGTVAQTARALLVWLHDRANQNRCRCCEQDEIGWAGHDPSMPCGELRDALKMLGPAVLDSLKPRP